MAENVARHYVTEINTESFVLEDIPVAENVKSFWLLRSADTVD